MGFLGTATRIGLFGSVGVAALSVFFASCFETAVASFAAKDLFCELRSPADEGTLSVCTGPTADGERSIEIAYVGRPPNFVGEVQLIWQGEEQPFQTIEIEARPLIDRETVGVLYLDMNFDGHKDLGVMRRAGSDGGYAFFLYDPEAGRFRQNSALEALSWPDFDARRERVRTYEEASDGARTVSEYVWREDGALALDLEQHWSGNTENPCIEIRYDSTGDEKLIVAQGPCG